jgi:hypothetical protein
MRGGHSWIDFGHVNAGGPGEFAYSPGKNQVNLQIHRFAKMILAVPLRLEVLVGAM